MARRGYKNAFSKITGTLVPAWLLSKTEHTTRKAYTSVGRKNIVKDRNKTRKSLGF